MFARPRRFIRKWMTDMVFALALGLGSVLNFIYIIGSNLAINLSNLDGTALDDWSGAIGLVLHILMVTGLYFWGNAGYPGRRSKRLPKSTNAERFRERELVREARERRMESLKLSDEQARAHARSMLLNDVERIAREHYGMNVLEATMAAHEAVAVLEERVSP